MLAFQHFLDFGLSLATSVTGKWEWRWVRFRVILVPGLFSAIYFSDWIKSWPRAHKQPKTSPWPAGARYEGFKSLMFKNRWFWSILSCNRFQEYPTCQRLYRHFSRGKSEPYEANWVQTTHFSQWFSWVIALQERKTDLPFHTSSYSLLNNT